MHLKVSSEMFDALYHHLYPGDGLEAIAFAFCGKHFFQGSWTLLVHEVVLVPHEICTRQEDRITWPTEFLTKELSNAEEKNLSVVKFHSHPNGLSEFSSFDDKSDRSIFDTLHSWGEIEGPFASVILLPNKKMVGREVNADLSFTKIPKFTVAGSNPTIQLPSKIGIGFEEADRRNRQTFGDYTTSLLKQMKVAVIGCSGTGSPVIEQLVRLGLGTIVLIDPDIVEHKNLNRIIGTKKSDADNKVPKTIALKNHVTSIGLDTKVIEYQKDLFLSKEARDEVITSDYVFGCVDSVEGRHLLNLLSTFYLLPYIDLGVSLKANGKGDISEILGAVHFVEPGKSSLSTRGVFTYEEVGNLLFRKFSENEYKKQLKEKYIKGASKPIESPAVISVNTLVAALGVNEFLARIHPFRNVDNSNFQFTYLNLCEWEITTPEEQLIDDKYLRKYVGRGDISPYLNMPGIFE